jgi:hypothetical protein
MLGESRLSRNVNRDLRLDFIRGLALYMVLVDHVIGDPISRFTYRVLGLSDAAEIFVFVSGLTCGIVYFRLLSKSGWQGLCGAIAGRATRIYVYYVLASLATVLLVTISGADIDTTLSAIARDPVHASWYTLGMLYSPPVSGILLLYLPLTLIVMPLFFWGARHNAVAALCVSGSVWLIAQLFPQFGTVVTERTWLNPLAWQFLFVIGLFFGMRYSASAEKPLFKRVEWFVAVAWMIVGFSFLYRFSIFIAPRIGFDLEWLRIPAATAMNMKVVLSPLRILHFLSMALLIATYVRSNSSILQSFIAKPFVMAGQRSLEMFSISVVLSMAANVYVLAESPSMSVRLILDCAMVSTMALTAIIITRSDRTRSALIGSRIRSG